MLGMIRNAQLDLDQFAACPAGPGDTNTANPAAGLAARGVGPVAEPHAAAFSFIQAASASESPMRPRWYYFPDFASLHPGYEAWKVVANELW